MKNISKKKVIIAAIVLVFVIALFCFVSIKNKTVVCTIDNEIIEGFKNQETIKFKLSHKKIKTVEYQRTVSISEFYQEYGTYTDSLKTILNNGYNYIDDVKITKSNEKVDVNFKLKDKGIILDNLIIQSNSETDKTSLRYDILSDYKTEKNAYKINDKYSKKQLKKSIEKLGYKCK